MGIESLVSVGQTIHSGTIHIRPRGCSNAPVYDQGFFERERVIIVFINGECRKDGLRSHHVIFSQSFSRERAEMVDVARTQGGVL